MSKKALITRRTALGGLFGMTTTGLSLGMADSNGVPKTLIVQLSPGSTSDLVARKLAELLAKTSNSFLTVENITGASGTIAINRLLSLPRDGTTLLLGNSGLVCSTPTLLRTQSGFDPQVDLVPICTVASTPFLLIARAGFSANNLRELERLYKGSNQHLTYAANEAGSANHIAGEGILQRLDLKGTHVPYRNTVQAVIDVMEGRVSLGIFSWQNIVPFLENEKARVLCTLSNTRLDLLPKIQTVADQGYGRFDIQGWSALFAASGTPQALIQEQERVMKSIFDQDEINLFIKKMGSVPAFRNSEDSRTYVNDEIRRYRGLLQRYKVM